MHEEGSHFIDLIRTARHEAHKSRFHNDYYRHMIDLTEAYEELMIKYPKLPKMNELNLPMLFECDDPECVGECEQCRELEDDYMFFETDKNNDIIEQWMGKLESALGLDENTIRPTGMARMRWAENC